MENKILKELHFISEKGGLFFREVRYILIRPETLSTLQKAMEREIGEKASEILFQSGYEGGSLSTQRYREAFQCTDEEVVQFMIRMGPQIGWGRFELETFDPVLKQLRVKIHRSPFAEAYGSSPLPVCHLIRGVLAGMASIVFKKEVRAKELSCLAEGNPFCRFEVIGFT